MKLEYLFRFTGKCLEVLFVLLQPCADSVPYEEALANRRVLLSSTESREGLAQQVSRYTFY